MGKAKTGPSRQTSSPSLWHDPQMPNPQRMYPSLLNWQGMRRPMQTSASLSSMASGPQA